MGEVLEFKSSGVTPDRNAVLAAQGVPHDAELKPRVVNLVDDALELFASLAKPVGIRQEIAHRDFVEVYEGEGKNAADTPLTAVLPEAKRLALFAVTVGEAVCEEIRQLFRANDPALGCMLDGVASAAAENLAASMASEYASEVLEHGAIKGHIGVLPYSPGYCGWDTSGQRRLFAVLRPEVIGIRLNSSCLMQPLKSVSGVLVAAPPEAHDVEPEYEFCVDCSTQECRERARSVLGGATGGV